MHAKNIFRGAGDATRDEEKRIIYK